MQSPPPTQTTSSSAKTSLASDNQERSLQNSSSALMGTLEHAARHSLGLAPQTNELASIHVICLFVPVWQNIHTFTCQTTCTLRLLQCADGGEERLIRSINTDSNTDNLRVTADLRKPQQLSSKVLNENDLCMSNSTYIRRISHKLPLNNQSKQC